MSGFAVLFNPDLTAAAQSGNFTKLLHMAAKKLSLSTERIAGENYTAAKLDSSASLHPGIVRDEANGSWLLAAGTIVSLSDDILDLRALLRDYVENGPAALQNHDGHFALVLYNGREKILSVISDGMALFSIFYGQRGAETVVATSALAVARHIHARPDRLAVEVFMRTGRVYGDRTLWQGVKRLPPATVLKITPARVKSSRYWSPTYDESIARLSFDDALAQATELLSDTFRRSLRREGPIWADLTGGFDTRITTTLMTRIGVPFITYCVGPAHHPDVQIAELVSGEMGWAYRRMPLPENWADEQLAWLEPALHRGDGHLNVVQLAGVLWGHQQRATLSRDHVTGGGGENWRGPSYWKGNLSNLGGRSGLNYDYILDARLFQFRVPAAVLSRDWALPVRRELRAYLESLAAPYADLPIAHQLDAIFMLHRHPQHGGAYLSASAGVMRSLIPLCFKAPTDFAFSLNYGWKLPYHHRFIRSLLERENPRLANIATTSGGPAVPLRLSNVAAFAPLWQSILDGATRKISKKLLGRTIRPKKSATGKSEADARQIRQGWLRYAEAENLLTPSHMRSAALYQADALSDLVSQAGAESFRQIEFLARVITVEMAMRASGASVE